MKINLTKGAEKIKVKDLETMKLALVYDTKSEENQLLLRAVKNNIVFQNFRNASGVCPLFVDDEKEYLFFGYIDDMDIINIKLR